MEHSMRQLPDLVSDARGTFQASAMAQECDDGRWAAWLEFVPTAQETSTVHVTPIETHQRDRVAAERWMSRLTRVYAEGALSRARERHQATPASQLLLRLEELVAALDRRSPQVDRAGEAQITADATRLRACAMGHIVRLRSNSQ